MSIADGDVHASVSIWYQNPLRLDARLSTALIRDGSKFGLLLAHLSVGPLRPTAEKGDGAGGHQTSERNHSGRYVRRHSRNFRSPTRIATT